MIMPKNTVLGGPSIATDDDQEVTEWDGTSSSTSPESQPIPSSEETTSSEEPAPNAENPSEPAPVESSTARSTARGKTTSK